MTPSTFVIKTLAYFSVFNFPLSLGEIQKFSGRLVATDLRDLVEEGTVKSSNGYYSLAVSELWVDRKDREELSTEKIKQSAKLFQRISGWPHLQAVLVTGSTAALNAEGKSDVDVLIISSPHTLWLTRLVVVLYLILTGTYRRYICPNIWLSADNLEWPDKNIHSAADAFLAKPILNKNQSYERFMEANRWIKDFWPLDLKDSLLVVQSSKANVLSVFLNQLLFSLEKLRRQLLNIKNVGDEVSYNRIHFRKNDSKDRILKRFEEIYKASTASGYNF